MSRKCLSVDVVNIESSVYVMYTRRYTVTTEVYTYTYYMYTVCMCLKDIHVHTFYSPLLVGVQGSVRSGRSCGGVQQSGVGHSLSDLLGEP